MGEKLVTPVNIPLRLGTESTKSKKKLKFEKNTVGSVHVANAELNDTIHRLETLVEEDKYSTSSISFRLFQDALKWHDSENTSAMRYSEATKEFFWTGKRLLGGQFLRFMRGFGQ